MYAIGNGTVKRQNGTRKLNVNLLRKVKNFKVLRRFPILGLTNIFRNLL